MNRKITTKTKTNNPTPQPIGTANRSVKASGTGSVSLPSWIRDSTHVLRNDLFLEPSQRQLRLRGVKYVPFLDFNNELLALTQAIINTSPTTQAIIRQKKDWSCGTSMNITTRKTFFGEQPAANPNQSDIDKMNEIFNKSNSVNDENFMDFLGRVAFDYWGFGNAFVEVVKTAQRTYFNHLPIYMCRPKTLNEGSLNVQYVGVSQLWEDGAIQNWSGVDLPMYPNFEGIGGARRSVIHLKNEYPNFYYWGMPDWFSARFAAELEYRVPRFNVAKFENGYTPSAMVQFFGNMADDEARAHVNNFIKSFTGTGNNSKIFAQFVDSPEDAAKVDILETHNDGEYTELLDIARNSIIAAHRWTPALAGVATAGVLGSNQQVRNEFEMVMNTVIMPFQQKLIRKIIEPYLSENGLGQYSVEIITSPPVSIADKIEPANVLSIDEQRAILGYAKTSNV